MRGDNGLTLSVRGVFGMHLGIDYCLVRGCGSMPCFGIPCPQEKRGGRAVSVRCKREKAGCDQRYAGERRHLEPACRGSSAKYNTLLSHLQLQAYPISPALFSVLPLTPFHESHSPNNLIAGEPDIPHCHHKFILRVQPGFSSAFDDDLDDWHTHISLHAPISTSSSYIQSPTSKYQVNVTPFRPPVIIQNAGYQVYAPQIHPFAHKRIDDLLTGVVVGDGAVGKVRRFSLLVTSGD